MTWENTSIVSVILLDQLQAICLYTGRQRTKHCSFAVGFAVNYKLRKDYTKTSELVKDVHQVLFGTVGQVRSPSLEPSRSIRAKLD